MIRSSDVEFLGTKSWELEAFAEVVENWKRSEAAGERLCTLLDQFADRAACVHS
jgi:hypothetical protein